MRQKTVAAEDFAWVFLCYTNDVCGERYIVCIRMELSMLV